MTVTYRVNRKLVRAWMRQNLPRPEKVLANGALISEKTALKVLGGEAPGYAMTRKAIADVMQLPEGDLFPMSVGRRKSA
jgi:hypothetical protein